MKKLFFIEAKPLDKTDDSLEVEYLICNQLPSFEDFKEHLQNAFIYVNDNFTEIDYLKLEEDVILYLPSALSHSLELKMMTKDEISKYTQLDFT